MFRKAIRRIVRRHRLGRAVRALRRKSEGPACGIARALDSARRWNFTAADRQWFDWIESVRRKTESSTEEVKIVDHGAGPRQSSQAPEPSNRPRERTLVVGSTCKSASKPSEWTTILFQLIREFQPDRCLELGTCMGISAAYQAAALERNGHGRLVTLEGAQALADIARSNLQRLGLRRVEIVVGRFQDSLDGVLQTLEGVDYAFIDGHHDERATVGYWEQIRPFLTDSAIVVFDDIRWSPGMTRAWKQICSAPRVDGAADLGAIGVVWQ